MPTTPRTLARPPASTVTIELPRRASLALRIAHPLSYATLRMGMNAIVALASRGIPFRDARNFHVSNLLDPLAAPLLPPRGTRTRSTLFERFRAEWVWHRDTPNPTEVKDSAILYFHGGGLVACGLNSHRRLVARIGRASGMPVFNVDYRQLPKGRLADTIQDCVESYEWLLAQGFPPERVIFAGDSAGGGLTFGLALAARERGLPMPAAIVAIAPWADYDRSRRDAHPNDRLDPMLSSAALALPARLGMWVDGALDPQLSPVNHHFTGLPPVFIQVGSTEVLLPDAEALAERCAEAGVPCTMQIWDKAIHVFHAAADLLPDARQAIGEIGAFNQRTIHGAVQRVPARRRFARRTRAA
ncbi:alpha/beta hydrolase [Nocardia colli]|uniref:Alpha/beta hydrolase n=1 Tax=Nocardia colli TaxID=2545717 RepID=A0A5N0EEH7_9NOCA|nr:alpha/beta hydrolase [Nocardia colli]KAA8887343.1 alpha/beta hydrolase [Nocardia colli]